ASLRRARGEAKHDCRRASEDSNFAGSPDRGGSAGTTRGAGRHGVHRPRRGNPEAAAQGSAGRLFRRSVVQVGGGGGCLPAGGAGLMGHLTPPRPGAVYVDTSAVIYFVEGIEPYRTASLPLWDGLDAGTQQVVTSELTLLEVLVKPIREGKAALAALFRNLLL